MLPPSRSLVVRCTGYGLVGVECEALTIEIEVEDVDGDRLGGRGETDSSCVRIYPSAIITHTSTKSCVASTISRLAITDTTDYDIMVHKKSCHTL